VITIQPLRHHLRHQPGQLLIPAGPRQAGPPDVITQIEMRVIHPDRPPQTQRHRAQLLPVPRHPRQAPRQIRQELLIRRYRALEHRDRRDRHRHMPVPVLRIDEYGRQRAQRVHDGPLTKRHRTCRPERILDRKAARAPAPRSIVLPARDFRPYAALIRTRTRQDSRRRELTSPGVTSRLRHGCRHILVAIRCTGVLAAPDQAGSRRITTVRHQGSASRARGSGECRNAAASGKGGAVAPQRRKRRGSRPGCYREAGTAVSPVTPVSTELPGLSDR